MNMQTININAPAISLEFGQQHEDLHINNLLWVPDGHISVLKDDTGIRMWLTAARDSYLLTGASLDTLELHRGEVLSPTNIEDAHGFNGYRGFGSVIPGTGRNADTLTGFYHNEWHPSANQQFPYTAAIGVAQSTDNGITWDSIGSIIEGPQMPNPMGRDRVFGAGQPSAIRIGKYVYVYHTQWSEGSSDSITVSRARLDNVLDLGSWETFTGGTSFNLAALGGQGTAIVSPTRSDDVYAALPGVSFNTALEKYVMTYETNAGFYLTTSDDGLAWNRSYQIAAFPQPQNPRVQNNTWFSYPTLLSNESDREIGSEAYLYFSRGIVGIEDHTMARVPVRISNNQGVVPPRLK